jgi:uncharacterized repeat protein (TIGR02543 family)
MRKIVFSLWMVALASMQPLSAQINSGSPAKPFGSNTSYQYGIMPTNLPAGGTYGGSKAAADAYDNWKTTYVEACDNGKYRVKFDNSAETVSEGIAYGMLLSAYAGDKTLFDGLWKYYNSYKNGNGVMNWKINGCNNTKETGGATDAELDAAMALIIAAKQWPSGTYQADAKALIKIIKNKEMTNDGQTINGDQWGMQNTCRNPSYFSPAYYAQFAKVDTDNATFWSTTAINAANSVLTANRNATTGLVSNWCTNTGTESTCGNTGGGANGYGADACRNPWRMAVDYLWHGNAASTAAKDINAKLAAFVGNKKMVGPITDRGGQMPAPGNGGNPPWENGTFSMFALPAMTASNQENLNSCYTKVAGLSLQYENYFGTTIRCITLFVLTGNFWSPDASVTPSCPVSYTVTFDVDGGTAVEKEEVCAGDKVRRPAVNPTKTGYAFKGWYTTATGNTAFDFNATRVNSNMTIYAQWEKGEGPTMVADCDNGNKTKFLTYWYAYDDNEVTPPGSSITDQLTDAPFRMTNPGAAGSDSAAVMTYTLNKGELPYDPFVGLGFDTNDPTAAYDLSCTSGITFYYKNSNNIKIRFMVKISSVTDDAHYGYDLPVESDWTPITISWSQLAQPSGWGIPVSWDAALITGFQWQIQGANGTSGTVGVDQVQLNDCDVILPIDTDVLNINSSISGLRIYPNPAKGGNFNVILPHSERAVLTICNQQGQAVYSTVINKGLTSIDTDLNAGIYIISLQSENRLEVQKLIVK